jgi:hypothetical protein
MFGSRLMVFCWKRQFVVTDAVDECLLGTKFLLENHCIWDFVKGTLIISGREVKLSERKSPASARRLYAADNVVIEKRSCVQVPTHVHRNL